jgi:hypothetical protein
MSNTDCVKVPYDTINEAREALDSFEIDEDHNRKPVRAYKCNIEGCDKYHVTSQGTPEKTKKNINRRDQKQLNRRKLDINAVIYNAAEIKSQKQKKGTKQGKKKKSKAKSAIRKT